MVDRPSDGRERAVVFTVATLSLIAGTGGTAIAYYNSLCHNPTGNYQAGFASAPPVVWDEQATLAMSVNTTGLFSNVTVSAPEDANGYGPAFLLNGATNAGYWYQVGITFDWGRGPASGYSPGFDLVTAVFAPTNPFSPKYEYVAPLNLQSGDRVRLGLAFERGCIQMSWVLPGGSTETATYSSYSATDFDNGSPVILDSGFQTSLMTEWWHVNPYFGPTAAATYTLPKLAGSYVGMQVEERIPSAGGAQLFSNATQARLGCGCTTVLEFENVTESVSWGGFTTG